MGWYGSYGYAVLIETLWNVKNYLRFNISFSLSVLIETSWNVKIFNGSGSGSWSFVLIETSWNVKQSSLLRNLRSQASINRNIVECKERTGYRYPCWEHRINRNIVECKAQYYGSNGVAWCCMNRNIVECKGRTGSNSRAGKGVLIETSWNVKSLFRKEIWFPYRY